MSVFFRHKMT